MNPLALLFRRLEDGDKRLIDIMMEIPDRFKSYVHGATKVCIRNVLGTLLVLYPAIDPYQMNVDYDDNEDHLATVERAEEELDGLATLIANNLDLRMEKPND
jgi:hypothetical protein